MTYRYIKVATLLVRGKLEDKVVFKNQNKVLVGISI